MDNVNVIRVGFLAPDFSLPDTEGKMFTLKDNLKGSFSVLCFFSDGDIANIRNFLKDLNSGLPSTASGLPVKVLAVSPEKIHRLNAFKKKLRLDFPILSDSKRMVSRRYYVADSENPKPAVHFAIFVIDDEGIVQYRVSELAESSRFDPIRFRAKISTLV